MWKLGIVNAVAKYSLVSVSEVSILQSCLPKIVVQCIELLSCPGYVFKGAASSSHMSPYQSTSQMLQSTNMTTVKILEHQHMALHMQVWQAALEDWINHPPPSSLWRSLQPWGVLMLPLQCCMPEAVPVRPASCPAIKLSRKRKQRLQSDCSVASSLKLALRWV